MPRRGNAYLFGRRTAAATVAGLIGGLAFVSASGPARAYSTANPAPNLVWSTLSPAVSPAPVAYAAAAYDTDNHTLVLFGGVTASGALSNNTWVWNGSTWRGFAGSQIVAPQARELAAMAFDPVLHQLVLFGGRAYGGQLLGDTWAWNGASWYQVGSRLTGQSPSPREGAAMAYDGHGDLVLFGGDGPPADAGSGPGKTAGASDPGLGALTRSSAETPATASPTGALGDTWLWTSEGWVQSHATGPAARTSATLAYDSDNGTVVMFGGSSTPIASGSPGYLADTWSWDGRAWSALPASTTPGGRFGAAAADDPAAGGAVLFGGAGPGGFLSDTWVWDGQGWSAAATSGEPDARAGAAGAYDSTAQQLVLFGGAAAPQGSTPGSAGGNYTIGSAGRVLGSTSVLTAGAPVGLGNAGGNTPGTGGGAAATTPAPLRPPPEAATPGTRSGAPTSEGSGGRATASALTVLHRGEVVTLRGSGFAPRTTVTVTFHSTPTVVGTTTSGPGGAFEITVAVPPSAAAGTHRFIASGEGPKGPLQLLIATVEVVSNHAGSRGGTTTAERAALVSLALAVPLATWLAMDAFGRWRRRPNAAAPDR